MPVKLNKSGDLLSETTSLLKRSLSGTSLASHEDLHSDLEVQLQSVHQNSRLKIGSESDVRTHAAYTWNKLLFPFLGSVLALLVLGLNFRSAPHEVIPFQSASNEVLPIYNGPPSLSLLDPIDDLKLLTMGRSLNDPNYPHYYYGSEDNMDPDSVLSFQALPTNAWYQNMLQVSQYGEPSDLQRVYPAPYLMDVVGPIPGLTIHPISIIAGDLVMQITYLGNCGLTLGAAKSLLNTKYDDQAITNRYNVLKTTELGITLGWEAAKMSSNIVRGMSYVTMEYEKEKDISESFLLPSITVEFELESPILVDGKKVTVTDSSQKISVEKDIEFYFPQIDNVYVAFFSEPVTIQISYENGKTLIQVVEYDKHPWRARCSTRSETLVIRAALVSQCSSCNGVGDEPEKDEYVALLREHADTYPGPDTSFSYVMDAEGDKADLIFDWDAKSMAALSCGCSSTNSCDGDMLGFALPHQMDRLSSDLLPNSKRYCKTTLTGPACLVKGKKWSLPQELPEIDFRAKRPPRPEFIPMLAESLVKDINYTIPDLYHQGAGDTYFSGKMMAKLARILLITEEVDFLCGRQGGIDYMEHCQQATLPSQEKFEGAIQELRSSVEVWINGTAETPFVYDTSWGGVVSCGAYISERGVESHYPNCPAFGDPGLNFGNGFYNDHHFHYGYFIFSASVVAHFDPEWGKKYFEEILLLVRDIANPSETDTRFPLYRHKDWYQGSSWASGITMTVANGKNQESSSEAIAAYEGVALYGQVMTEIWRRDQDAQKVATSQQIADVGRLLTATELTSAKKYWHVPDRDDPTRVYPVEYAQHAVGILWQTMAQFGTWFGGQAYLPIGIQMLPLTPISEERDDLKWMNSIYEPFRKGCAADMQCPDSGWAVLEIAALATIGYAPKAAEQLKALPDDAFEDAGGNGHSRSNTLWYVATRKAVVDPIELEIVDTTPASKVLTDCYKPDTCTNEVLNRMAGEFSCRDRMKWLIQFQPNTREWDACWMVAGVEYPDICAPCNPGSEHRGPIISN